MRLRGAILGPLAAIGLILLAPGPAQRAAAQAVPQSVSTAAQPGYTIRMRAPLTIVDVVVTDARGNPVHGLKQSDFTMLEDGKEMRPNSFEEHRADSQPGPVALEQTMLNLPPDTFTNAVPAPPSDRPLDILILDRLNIPMQAQQQVTQRMIDFVEKMPPGTRMAIFNLTTKLTILQGFTTDRELLKSILSSKKGMADFSPVEDPGQDPIQDPLTAEEEGNHAALRGQYTLSAMRQIARYVFGMPGRKNLIWITSSFPLQYPPVEDPDIFGGLHRAASYDFEAELKSANDLLTRAHVVAYPIEARGLEKPDLLPRCGNSTTCMTNKSNMHMAEYATMDTIAEQTGGHAFYNTNGFSEAAEQAVDSGSNFYTFTYAPTNQVLDTRFRTITVKVGQPGLQLVYRPGYYAVEPTVDARGKKIEVVTPMQSAMMRGGIDSTQVLFKVKVTQAPGTEMTLPVGNTPDARRMKPPYRHLSLSYVIDVHGIDFTVTPDGNYRGDFEYTTMVYNADGDEVMNSVTRTVSPILVPAVYQSMLRGGANAHQEIDVPATGEYFLRIGVHDLGSGRVGSIEIPVSSITSEAGS
jgi:VWFA-related protein